MKSRRMSCTVSLIAASFVFFAMTIPSIGEGFKEKAKEAGKATVNYPAELVKEGVNVVGKAASGGAKMVGDTVKATGETMAGKSDKAKDIVKTPINQSVGTVRDAAVGTVEAPVKAAKQSRQ